jgi:1-acyl-sn-glycerol-3-phosphate acyltransferase
LFRTARAIPIASAKENPQLLEEAYASIDKMLARGEVVCIFPEGQITRTGELNPFRQGIAKIIERRPVPVVPMALTGLWGTFFSRAGAGVMRRLPKPLWHKVILRLGPVLPPDQVTGARLQEVVTELGAEQSSSANIK